MAIKIPHAHKGRPSAPHLRRQKMSVIGKTSYQHQGKMAFPGSAPAADANQGPPAPPMLGGEPPDMAGGTPPAPPME